MTPHRPPLERASEELRAAVAQAYDVFARHLAPPFPLDVCLVCCTTPEIEQALREWPLSRLTAHHFREYNTSAHSGSTPVAEIGHFLPRMLELLAAGEDIHPSVEVALRRVGQCPTDAWRPEERSVLDRFALALFEEVLHGSLAHRWHAEPWSVLLMFDIGGVSVAPLLEAWSRCSVPSATAQYVECAYWFYSEGETYANPFADDRPEFGQRIRSWVLDPACRRLFAARLRDPVFLEAAALHDDFAQLPFTTIADIVLWYLER